MAAIGNTSSIYKVDHSTFGGIIDIEDFSTNTSNRRRIKNQMNALTFQKSLENKRKTKEDYKNMTLEELKEMKIISNTDGRPTNNLTNEKWQKELNIRKLFVTPYKDGRTKKLTGKHYKESGQWNDEKKGSYDGCTNWQSYCTYINDVLKNIRAGQIDYCYFIYQIMDLLKFHFEDLRTRYRDGYWEVWLAKGETNC